MRLFIDRDRCTGHGRCYTLFPSLFVDDEDGYGTVLGDGAVAEADEARRAIATCPERAISLVEG